MTSRDPREHEAALILQGMFQQKPTTLLHPKKRKFSKENNSVTTHGFHVPSTASKSTTLIRQSPLPMRTVTPILAEKEIVSMQLHPICFDKLDSSNQRRTLPLQKKAKQVTGTAVKPLPPPPRMKRFSNYNRNGSPERKQSHQFLSSSKNSETIPRLRNRETRNKQSTTVPKQVVTQEMMPFPQHAAQLINLLYNPLFCLPISENISDMQQPYSKGLPLSELLSFQASQLIPSLPDSQLIYELASSNSSRDSVRSDPAKKKKKSCKMEGCGEVADKRSPYCTQHRGQRKCEHSEGCNKFAQSKTRFCIKHGGGRRCTIPGCFKGARDKHFCGAHGGGKRCSVEACQKLSVGGDDVCTAHGGGKRCQADGCGKCAQSSSNFCVRHGGGRKCRIDGCSKVARGKSGVCMSHATTMKE